MKILLLACSLAAAAPGAETVRVTETAGVARTSDPVCVALEGRQQCFFVTIGARESKVVSTDDLRPSDRLEVHFTDPVGFQVENSVYLADLSKRILSGNIEDSGVLRGLVFKQFGVRLARDQNRMHWAPSFQREGARSYTSIATWHPVQKARREQMPGVLTFTRDGHHEAYPEIGLHTEYRFFAHAPYFLFHSTMTIEKPIAMYWLRNQEMTMDGFFTHVAWRGEDGKPVIVDFEQRKPILEKKPLAADIPWVAFLNRDKGYGYGAIVLDYKATKTANAQTSINDGARGGRYWDRRLINQVATPLAAGERYEERTAYLLFRCEGSEPMREFLEWEKRIRNPVRVEAVR
jgi:hypothetical protein